MFEIWADYLSGWRIPDRQRSNHCSFFSFFFNYTTTQIRTFVAEGLCGQTGVLQLSQPEAFWSFMAAVLVHCAAPAKWNDLTSASPHSYSPALQQCSSLLSCAFATFAPEASGCKWARSNKNAGALPLLCMLGHREGTILGLQNQTAFPQRLFEGNTTADKLYLWWLMEIDDVSRAKMNTSNTDN